MQPASLIRPGESGSHRTVRITETPFRIGRSPSNQLEISNPEVSRQHAEIVWNEEGFVIRDQQSRAGTFVNGESVVEQPLTSGDRIRLGPRIELVFKVGSEADTPSRSESSSSSSAIIDLRQTAALLEGLRAVGSSRVLEHVLDLVLDSAIEITRAQRGFIMLVSDAGTLEFKTGRDRDKRSLSRSQFKTSRKIPNDVLRTGRSRLENLQESPEHGRHDQTLAIGIRSVLCAPLTTGQVVEGGAAIHDERRIGVLYLDSRERSSFKSSAIQTSLEALAHEAAGAIEKARLYRQAEEKARLEHDLQTAYEFQQALLPQSAPNLGYFEAAARMVPCRMIGGDFFEYVELEGSALGFTLGDVAGKGASAGLLGARIQEVFAAHAQTLASPAATIDRINTTLLKRSLQSRFVTMVYGVLTPNGHLIYCNAGHNPPVLATRDGVRRLDTGGLIVGLFDDAVFEEETIELDPGDLLVVFSDGVSEATNPAGDEFGDTRILECVKSATDGDPEMVLARLFDALRAFTGDAAQADDDMTVLVLRYQGDGKVDGAQASPHAALRAPR